MSPESSVLTPDERDELELTALSHELLEEQYQNLEQQHEVAALGMWAFLATEVLFFGTLFLGLITYRYLYPLEFELATVRLNWAVGCVNTVVLLISSVFMVLAVHACRLGENRRAMHYLLVTALLGCAFLVFKGYEYYTDWRENLIPGWRFEDAEWIALGLRPEQVPHVKLFLLFYWFMTPLHALHVTIGIAVVLLMAELTRRGRFSPVYYSPVDVTGLYWHFVDIVFIFLFPLLYLLGTHGVSDLHF
jgi:cytochrome c oxidase subunit 3